MHCSTSGGQRIKEELEDTKKLRHSCLHSGSDHKMFCRSQSNSGLNCTPKMSVGRRYGDVWLSTEWGGPSIKIPDLRHQHTCTSVYGDCEEYKRKSSILLLLHGRGVPFIKKTLMIVTSRLRQQIKVNTLPYSLKKIRRNLPYKVKPSTSFIYLYKDKFYH